MTNTFVLSVMITVIMSSIVSLFMMLSNGAIGCERKSSISYTSCCFPPLSLFLSFPISLNSEGPGVQRIPTNRFSSVFKFIIYCASRDTPFTGRYSEHLQSHIRAVPE